jgi:uncharacterized protein with NAD-binding domain and iron-sulfur cluster
MGPQTRQKIAILGGGIAAMATAFELTDRVEDRECREVTVYQLGWRLGGKGASGRNADPDMAYRIEEHGLHVWFGFYENAFTMIRKCYKELARSAGSPLATWTDAFKPASSIVLADDFEDQWSFHQTSMPTKAGSPGDGVPLPTFPQMVATAFSVLTRRWTTLRPQLQSTSVPPRPSGTSPFSDVATALKQSGTAFAEEARLQLLSTAATSLKRLPCQAASTQLLGVVACLARGVRDWMYDELLPANIQNSDFRFFFTIFDLTTTILVGVTADDLLQKGFDSVDDQEFSAWLRHHGAKPVTLGVDPMHRSPFLRSLYDVSFAYIMGDPRQANMAAGRTVAVLLRMLFTYQGAFYYKMQAGCGDTVFAPLYQVLRNRGVRFEFFSDVRALRLSSDRRRVETIEIERQAQLTGDTYEPLVNVLDLPCWLNAPDPKQIRNPGDGNDYELSGAVSCGERLELHSGCDFDHIVLAIPPSEFPILCADLIADVGNPAFATMVHSTFMVETSAVQLWLRKPTATQKGLGWSFDPVAILGTYVEPVDTTCPMDHLLPRECWPPEAEAAGVIYACGFFNFSNGNMIDPVRAHLAAKSFVAQNLGLLLPAAQSGGSFDWDLLVDPQNRSGDARFEAQFVRLNSHGWDGYVLTPAGTLPHRLRADQSGYDNLVLAGDWVRNGLDSGCMEAAVMSGMQAAQAIDGRPRTVVGETDEWMTESGPTPRWRQPSSRPTSTSQPSYVEYGSFTNGPGPYVSDAADLYAFFLKADYQLLNQLVSSVFAAPSNGAVRFWPLLDRVMLTMGTMPVCSTTPPFDRMGFVEERHAALWVLLMADCARLPLGSVAAFIPMMFIENQLSLIGGREVMGYAKAPGWIGLPQPAGPLTFSVDGLGGNYSPTTSAQRIPLLTIAPTGEGSSETTSFDGIGAALDYLIQEFFGDGPVIDLSQGHKAPASILQELNMGQLTQVFLRQFRSSVDGRFASQQQIVTTSTQACNTQVDLISHPFQVSVMSYDSHPFARQLGLENQEVSFALHARLGFEQSNGTVIWDAGSEGGSSSQPPGLCGWLPTWFKRR